MQRLNFLTSLRPVTSFPVAGRFFEERARCSVPGPNGHDAPTRGGALISAAAIGLTDVLQARSMTGSLQLRDYPGDMVRLSCPKCGRAGQYKKQTLIERYGAYVRLPDLKDLIAKCRHRGMHDACMAQYDDLVTRR